MLPETKPATVLSNPEQWLELYGDYLFKFAIMRVRDQAIAEDLVQETFLAAIKGGKSFAGKAVEKSWLTGILKNKIFDYYRKSAREISFTNLEFNEEENERFVSGGARDGSWLANSAPQQWADVGNSLDNELFWKTYRDCAGRLPKNVAAVFNLREVDGVESREICLILNISENNLWVMLHRARGALRRCMETNWFDKNKV